MSARPSRPHEIVVVPSMTCPACGRVIRLSSNGVPYRHRDTRTGLPVCTYPGVIVR